MGVDTLSPNLVSELIKPLHHQKARGKKPKPSMLLEKHATNTKQVPPPSRGRFDGGGYFIT